MAPTCFMASPRIARTPTEVKFVPAVDFFTSQCSHIGGIDLASGNTERDLNVLENETNSLLLAAKLGASEQYFCRRTFKVALRKKLANCCRANAPKKHPAIGVAEIPSRGLSPRSMHAFVIWEPPCPASLELHIFLPGERDDYPAWINEVGIYRDIIQELTRNQISPVVIGLRELCFWAEPRAMGVPGMIATEARATAKYLRGFCNLQKASFVVAPKRVFFNRLPSLALPVLGHLMRFQDNEWGWAHDAARIITSPMLDSACSPDTTITAIAKKTVAQEHYRLTEGILQRVDGRWEEWNGKGFDDVCALSHKAFATVLGITHEIFVSREAVRSTSRKMWESTDMEKLSDKFWFCREKIAATIWA